MCSGGTGYTSVEYRAWSTRHLLRACSVPAPYLQDTQLRHAEWGVASDRRAPLGPPATQVPSGQGARPFFPDVTLRTANEANLSFHFPVSCASPTSSSAAPKHRVSSLLRHCTALLSSVLPPRRYRCVFYFARLAVPALLSRPSSEAPPRTQLAHLDQLEMARTKQLPVKRDASSEYFNKQKEEWQNTDGRVATTPNGHVAASVSNAEAGLVQLVIAVAGIYASL